jgi:hypothetical protein
VRRGCEAHRLVLQSLDNLSNSDKKPFISADNSRLKVQLLERRLRLAGHPNIVQALLPVFSSIHDYAWSSYWSSSSRARKTSTADTPSSNSV